VLAPLWPVDDYATFRLMNGFYAQLAAAENTDLATALARTTADMRTTRKADQLSPIAMSDGSGWWRRIFKSAPAPQPAVSAVGGRRGLARAASNSEAPSHDLSHPDHWAAFALYGLPDTVG
jgi:CHAT domain-containing protein